jgi:hypothetical protein
MKGRRMNNLPRVGLNIYTHVIDASHCKAVEAVEERLFGEMDCLE